MSSIPSDLLAFLRSAKLATYAAGDTEMAVQPLLPESKQLEFSQGRYLYRDVYFGMLRFVGQEVVYFDGRPLWSLAYAGGLTPDVEAREAVPIYRVLRAALSATPADLPLRGPGHFEIQGMRYTCLPIGNLEAFYGEETVSRDERRLYELRFSGGALA